MVRGLQSAYGTPDETSTIITEAGGKPEMCLASDYVQGTPWNAHGRWRCLLNNSSAVATIKATF